MMQYTTKKTCQAHNAYAEKGKRHKSLFQKLKRSFISKAMVAALALTFSFCPVRRATADEINKIPKGGTVRVEIIQNKMSDQDAERLLSYSKSLLNEGKRKEAKKILESVKIYNANKDILDDAEYTIGKIHYLSGKKYETLKIYKKMCYLYPRSDVITTGKLAKTLVNIIKKETEAKQWEHGPGSNFTSSTYAFQILKYDYPKGSLKQTTLTQAKDLIDKMLDTDIGEQKYNGPRGFWKWYHIGDVRDIFGKEVGKVDGTTKLNMRYQGCNSYGKLKLLWKHWKHYREFRLEEVQGIPKNVKYEWSKLWWETKKGATLRKILKDCTSLDPYSWTGQSSGEDIFE